MAERDQVRVATPVDEKREKALTDAIQSHRNQCRWLTGLGFASVMGTVLKSDLFTGGGRAAIIFIAALVIVFGLLGGISRHRGDVDQIEYLATLESLAKGARRYRNACVTLLILAIVIMVAQLIG